MLMNVGKIMTFCIRECSQENEQGIAGKLVNFEVCCFCVCFEPRYEPLTSRVSLSCCKLNYNLWPECKARVL